VSWRPVCRADQVPVERGICALVDGQQVALFRTADGELFALSNQDPFSGAMVLSRGIVGSTVLTDYFPTGAVPIDRYNTDNLTMMRGPNAILFGIGSPSGVVGASTKRAQLNTQLAPAFVEGDVAQIRQVLMNLITNASDALGEGNGEIRVPDDSPSALVSAINPIVLVDLAAGALAGSIKTGVPDKLGPIPVTRYAASFDIEKTFGFRCTPFRDAIRETFAHPVYSRYVVERA